MNSNKIIIFTKFCIIKLGKFFFREVGKVAQNVSGGDNFNIAQKNLWLFFYKVSPYSL